MSDFEYVSVKDRLPIFEGYYKIKYIDGTEDEKPFRIRTHKNIYGFMTEKEVSHWKNEKGLNTYNYYSHLKFRNND